MALKILLCCNDPDNGNILDHCETVEIERGDETITLEGGTVKVNWHFDRALKSVDPRIVGPHTLRVGRALVPFWQHKGWYGNWCWEAFYVSWPSAFTVLNYLAKRGWQCTEAAEPIYSAVNQRHVVTHKEWRRGIE